MAVILFTIGYLAVSGLVTIILCAFLRSCKNSGKRGAYLDTRSGVDSSHNGTSRI